LCLKVMQMTIPESFRGSVSDFTLALDYLKKLEQRFVRNEKAKIGILLNKLCTMKYNDRNNVREYIFEMMNTASKLKARKLDISEDMLVYLSLNSLPTSFGQFKVSYNYQKESLTVNELISHCVQEEERLKTDKSRVQTLLLHLKEKGNRNVKSIQMLRLQVRGRNPLRTRNQLSRQSRIRKRKGVSFVDLKGT
jgi:gag-polypeptide of LTR copia-type